MRKLLVLGLALGLVFALAVPAAAAPRGANILIWDSAYPVECGAETTTGDVEGCTILHEPGDGSGLVAHFNFHLTWTFTNADGDSRVFRDVGHAGAHGR